VAGAEGNLLSLGEVLINVAVELEFTDVAEGNLLNRPDLGSIKNVKLKVVLIRLLDKLDVHVPFGVGTRIDCGVEILAVEVRILTSKLESLVPDKAVYTKMWSEVELDKSALALVVVKSVGVDTESLHHTVRARNASVRVGPHEHVSRLLVQVLKVPKVVVSGLCLRHLVVWLWLAGVDNIGKLDGVLDEKDRHVVTNDIPVALLGVELHGETTDIANSVGRATATKNGGKSEEERGKARGFSEDLCAGHVGQGLLQSESTKGSGTTGVDNTLWNTLVVEAVNLLTGKVVLEESWA